jgi:hypothetical protein
MLVVLEAVKNRLPKPKINKKEAQVEGVASGNQGKGAQDQQVGARNP